MATLDVCNLCGGQGFIRVFPPGEEAHACEGRPSRCPGCQGAGTVESWRQGGGPGRWEHGPADRMGEAVLRCLLRHRGELDC